MSTVTAVNQTANQVQFNTDISKVFIGDNDYVGATFINLTGGALSYLAGALVGRISASGNITMMKSGASDGSEKPIGILKTDITALAGSGTIDVNFCTKGSVAEEKIIFDGSDTMLTVVDGSIIRDLIASNSTGIRIVAGTEMTSFDNQ